MGGMHFFCISPHLHLGGGGGREPGFPSPPSLPATTSWKNTTFLCHYTEHFLFILLLLFGGEDIPFIVFYHHTNTYVVCSSCPIGGDDGETGLPPATIPQ